MQNSSDRDWQPAEYAHPSHVDRAGHKNASAGLRGKNCLPEPGAGRTRKAYRALPRQGSKRRKEDYLVSPA